MNLSSLFNILNENCDYAVLRNYEELPQKSGRDIDLIIDRKDFFSIRERVVDFFIESGYCLVQYYKGSEMHSLVFGRVEQGEVDFVSFDFLFSIYVRNLILFESKEILKNRRYVNGVYVVREDDEFLSKYLYNRLLNENYPEKYLAIKNIAYEKYWNDISKKLKNIFGKETLDYGKQDIKDAGRFCWQKHFCIQIIALIRYLLSIISNVVSPIGISIAFTGPDGVGKTTVIDIIKEKFSKLFGDISLFHFRPLLFSNLGEVAYNVGLKKEVDRDYRRPHRGGKVGMVNSLLRLFYYAIDYIVGYYKLVEIKLFRRNIVIFDRYYTDVICDSRRSRIFLNYKFLYWFGRVFVPQLDYNVLLTASVETILARKQELTREGIERINEKIEYLAGKRGYVKFVNDGAPEEVVTEILEWVFEEQHRRNLKRLL